MTPEIYLLTALDSDIHDEKWIYELKLFARHEMFILPRLGRVFHLAARQAEAAKFPFG